jgi:hypothetical protein
MNRKPSIIYEGIDPFVILRKNLTFEDDSSENEEDENQQNDNTDADDDTSFDTDDDIDEEPSDDMGDSTDSPTSGDSNDSGNNSGMGGEGNSGGMGGDAGTDPNDDAEAGKKGVGSVNRKYTLFTEYVRIVSAIKETVSSLEDIASSNTELKDCVSQLAQLSEDGDLIISRFKQFNEADLMIQLDILKRRASFLIDRLKNLKIDKEKLRL